MYAWPTERAEVHRYTELFPLLADDTTGTTFMQLLR